jgi:dipeptidyl aminopeptidase/acylaminoacyl peptidase
VSKNLKQRNGVHVNKYILIVSLVLLSFSTQATKVINDNKIKSEKNCFSSIFESYGSWRGFLKNKYAKRSKSKAELSKKLSWFDSMFNEQDFNQYKNNLSCNNFIYQVDGNDVDGFIIRPKTNSKKLPVLVYNRGGNGSYGSVTFGSMMNNLFPIANQGFVIIGSQYRGRQYPGTLTEGVMHDEFGGKDVEDVIRLLDFIPKVAGADAERIGMFGYSRGGMQTHLTVKHTNKVKAIATIAGASDLLEELSFRPAMENVYKKRIPNYETNKVAELKKRSVLNWVNELSDSVPILLIHGENDERVSVKNSIELAAALTKHNIPNKLVVYSNDNHGLEQNKAKMHQELVTWFHHYL